MNTQVNWMKLLDKRLRMEMTQNGYQQVDVCNIRMMKTVVPQMYAVVVADVDIYVITGYSENEMSRKLLERVANKETANPRELIHLY